MDHEGSANHLCRARQSTCIGIGGDPINGTALDGKLFHEDPDTEAIIFTRNGGTAEEEAAEFTMDKPCAALLQEDSTSAVVWDMGLLNRGASWGWVGFAWCGISVLRPSYILWGSLVWTLNLKWIKNFPQAPHLEKFIQVPHFWMKTRGF